MSDDRKIRMNRVEIVDVADGLREELGGVQQQLGEMLQVVDAALDKLGHPTNIVSDDTLAALQDKFVEVGLDDEQSFISDSVICCLQELQFYRDNPNA